MAQLVSADDMFPSVTMSLELWVTVMEGINEAITFYSHRKVADFDKVRQLTEVRDEIMSQTSIPGGNHGEE